MDSVFNSAGPSCFHGIRVFTITKDSYSAWTQQLWIKHNSLPKPTRGRILHFSFLQNHSNWLFALRHTSTNTTRSCASRNSFHINVSVFEAVLYLYSMTHLDVELLAALSQLIFLCHQHAQVFQSFLQLPPNTAVYKLVKYVSSNVSFTIWSATQIFYLCFYVPLWLGPELGHGLFAH